MSKDIKKTTLSFPYSYGDDKKDGITRSQVESVFGQTFQIASVLFLISSPSYAIDTVKDKTAAVTVDCIQAFVTGSFSGIAFQKVKEQYYEKATIHPGVCVVILYGMASLYYVSSAYRKAFHH